MEECPEAKGTGEGQEAAIYMVYLKWPKTLNRGLVPAALAKDQLSIYKMLPDSFYGFQTFGGGGSFLLRPHSFPLEPCCEVPLKVLSLFLKLFPLRRPVIPLPLSLCVESSLESCQMKATKDNWKSRLSIPCENELSSPTKLQQGVNLC